MEKLDGAVILLLGIYVEDRKYEIKTILSLYVHSSIRAPTMPQNGINLNAHSMTG